MPNADKTPRVTDRELVELLKGGSKPAFEELYVRHKDRLLSSCERFLKNDTDSENVVQDVFLQLWETRDRLNVKHAFATYIHKLAANRILNMMRKYDIHSRYVRYALHNEKTSSNETEDTTASADYRVEILNILIEGLPPRQKQVFRLNRIDGLKYNEIAETLGISVSTVQKHASEALKNIQKHFKLGGDIHIYIMAMMLLSYYS